MTSIIFSILLLRSLTATAFEVSGIELYLDYVPIKSEVECESLNGRMIVPLRLVAEHFSMQVRWNGGNNTISVQNGGDRYEFGIGSRFVRKNGSETVNLMNALYLKDNRTMIEVDFFQKHFAKDAQYLVKDFTGYVFVSEQKSLVSKEQKEQYFDVIFKNRWDRLPTCSKDSPPDLEELLFWMFFDNTDRYKDNSPTIYKDDANTLLEARFGMSLDDLSVNQSLDKWEESGDKYVAGIWSFSDVCFCELVSHKVYEEAVRSVHEIMFREYTSDAGFEWSDDKDFTIDTAYFDKNSGQYSKSVNYIMSVMGKEIKNGMSFFDAAKTMVINGDTLGFRLGRYLTRIKYYQDESGNYKYISAENFYYSAP